MGAFREEEYRGCMTAELAARSLPWLKRGFCWNVERVAEELLGFDGAYRPARRNIWRILGAHRPNGVVLNPRFWESTPKPSAADIAKARVSLLLQYKIAEARKGRKGLFGMWTPYLRFEVKSTQHSSLLALERNLSGDQALVRYAAPAFTDRADLVANHEDRVVMHRSTYVSPTAIGGHQAWAYVGPGLNGCPNPDGEESFSDGLEDLGLELRERARTVTIADHLASLAAGVRRTLNVRERAAVRGVVRELEEHTELEQETVARIADLATFSTAVSKADATWRIVELPSEGET